MTDKEIFDILYKAIGRDTVDRFIENADGDLLGHAQVSLEDLAKEIAKQVEAENAELTVALEVAEKDKENLLRTLEECNEELKQIRKDTAKEILRDMQLRLLYDYTDEEMGHQYPTIATADIYQDLEEIAEQYGVEVDDE